MSKMIVTFLTLFPDSFNSFLQASIIGRAQKNGSLVTKTVNLRDFAKDNYNSVDDKPYGGGVGMVLRVDVVANAIKKIRTKKSHVILLTPEGKPFNQQLAKVLSTYTELIFICGHYEGFDERIKSYVDQEISIGDFVLTGGELAAATITDAVVRLIPGVLGKNESSIEESFSENLLEYPHYTRPAEYDGQAVPKVLLSGDHAEIKKWRRSEAIKITHNNRPDLEKY